MKKRFVIFLSIVLLWSCSDNNPTNNNVINPPFENDSECLAQHFYYNTSIDDKYFFDTLLLTNKIFIGFEKTTPHSEIVKFINKNSIFEEIDESKIIFHSYEYFENDHKLLIAKVKNDKTCSELYEIMSSLKTNPIVAFASYTYQSGLWFGGVYYDVMSYNDLFLVKVFDYNDLTDLNEVVKQTNTFIKEQNEYMPDWFLIGVTKDSKYDNALKMAQYFFETGKFAHSYVGFVDFIDKD